VRLLAEAHLLLLLAHEGFLTSDRLCPAVAAGNSNLLEKKAFNRIARTASALVAASHKGAILLLKSGQRTR